MTTRYEQFICIAGATLVVPVLLWFAGWLLVGDAWLPIRWGAYIAPLLALASLLGAGLLLLVRRVWTAACSIALAILILLPVLPRFSPARWFQTGGSGDLRVMTFNTSMLNADMGAVAQLITDQKPDIVFMQQMPDLPSLLGALEKEPLHIHYNAFPDRTTDDVLILSRYSLRDRWPFSGRVTAVADIGRCAIRLWSLHAPHGHWDVEPQGTFFHDAAAAMSGDELPIIAGGDLNSTEYNNSQAPLRELLDDDFAEAGVGFGFTFPSHLRRSGTAGPWLRIDHIFHRGLDHAHEAEVLQVSGGSDHFPVLAIFAVPRRCAL